MNDGSVVKLLSFRSLNFSSPTLYYNSSGLACSNGWTCYFRNLQAELDSTRLEQWSLNFLSCCLEENPSEKIRQKRSRFIWSEKFWSFEQIEHTHASSYFPSTFRKENHVGGKKSLRRFRYRATSHQVKSPRGRAKLFFPLLSRFRDFFVHLSLGGTFTSQFFSFFFHRIEHEFSRRAMFANFPSYCWTAGMYTESRWLNSFKGSLFAVLHTPQAISPFSMAVVAFVNYKPNF